MNSSDTSVTTEQDGGAVFAAKLAAVDSKLDAKTALGRERTFLSRTFFGGKKASADESQPPAGDARKDAQPGDASQASVSPEKPAAASEAAETAASPALPATDTPVSEATNSSFTTQPAPAMPSDSSATPSGTQATLAQLSLSFEITSLQLTPFFKLGGVQLKASSNVVALHLVTEQAQENPLAANIGFQIEQVDLDAAQRFKSVLLKPLSESRSLTAPSSKLQVDAVTIASGEAGAPISVTTSGQAATAVQLFGTFAIAEIRFTPAFEIESMRLEPTSNTVLLRVVQSSRPTALDLPPAFEVEQVQLGDGAQIAGMRVSPTAPKPS